MSYFVEGIKTEENIDTTIRVAQELGVNYVSGSAVDPALKMVDSRREGFKVRHSQPVVSRAQVKSTRHGFPYRGRDPGCLAYGFVRL